MRARLALPLVVASMALSFATGAAGADVGTALGPAIARLSSVTDVKGKKLGVGDFPLPGGRTSELGAYLADQIDVALTARASASGFDVVTRSQLCQVIRENKLWVDDRFDPSLHKKLGRLGQADFMLTGQVTPLGNRASVSLRLLETETGRSAWADSISLPLDDGLKRLAERPLVAGGCNAPAGVVGAVVSGGTPPAAQRLEVKVWTDRSSYRIGESVRFGLRVNRDAYVTLVNIGTSGDVTILYPNRFHPTHFVRAGQDVTIPPAEAGFELKALGPVGFDQVRVIATSEPVTLHASDFGKEAPMFRSLDRGQTRNLAVTIKTERERVGAGGWAEDVIAIQIGR